MKITNESIVTITVKDEKIKAPAWMLNTISMWASEVSGFYKNQKCLGLAKEAEDVAHVIFEQLKNLGLYEGI